MAIMLMGMLLAGAASGADEPLYPMLHRVDGKSSPGEIRSSNPENVLRWQDASTDAPRVLEGNEVAFIAWPPKKDWLERSGEFRFELAAGDVLFGWLLALDGQQAELEIPRRGRIHVQRSSLCRVDRWHGGDGLIYEGPRGLAGWREPPGQHNWRDEAGRPATDREGASIHGDFGIPDRAIIDFAISWKTRPDFAFALGVDDKPNTLKQAFRFETWGGDLVVQRELEREADLAVVQEIAPGGGWTHLEAYLDQEKGRILVFSPAGKPLADMFVSQGKPAAGHGLYLASMRGDVRLDRLRIRRWDGTVPREPGAGEARLLRSDGTTVYGQLTGWRAASKEFAFKTEEGDSLIPKARVASVFLSAPQAETPRMFRAVSQDGSQVSGEILRVKDATLVMAVPGIAEPLRLPLADLRFLVVLRHANAGRKPVGAH